MHIINGREVNEKLLEDLLKATKENIEGTTKQNERMGRYTFWIFVMTIVITVSTIIQVVFR